MFVRGKWVDFEARAINQIYQLWEDDGEEYQAFFVATHLESLMQELTQGQGGMAAPSVDERVHHISDDSTHSRGEGLV